MLNKDVPGPESSGFVNFFLGLERIKKGGGPTAFKPLEFSVRVVTDSANRVTNCANSSSDIQVDTGMDLHGTIVEPLPGYIKDDCKFMAAQGRIDESGRPNNGSFDRDDFRSAYWEDVDDPPGWKIITAMISEKHNTEKVDVGSDTASWILICQ